MTKQGLGDRMKSQYESRTRYFLPRRTYTIIRLDGKAFHTYTKKLDKPVSFPLMKCMNLAAEHLLKEVQGAKYAYVQSDEISILLTDFETPTTQAWFDGKMDKVLSVATSVTTAWFNKYANMLISDDIAYFDARVFTIPDRSEVINYFIHRNKDAIRNSVSMHAQSLYSHNDLLFKGVEEQKDLIVKKGEDWEELDAGFKYGRLILPRTSYEEYVKEQFKFDNETLQSLTPKYDLE